MLFVLKEKPRPNIELTEELAYDAELQSMELDPTGCRIFVGDLKYTDSPQVYQSLLTFQSYCFSFHFQRIFSV